MKMKGRFYWLLVLLLLWGFGNAQTDIGISAEREQMFMPFLAIRHGGIDSLAKLKRTEPARYYKDLWYYTSSFYVKRNHYPEGYALTEKNVDISRYENQRRTDQEAFVRVGGTCDALVLLPSNKLLHKPSFIR